MIKTEEYIQIADNIGWTQDAASAAIVDIQQMSFDLDSNGVAAGNIQKDNLTANINAVFAKISKDFENPSQMMRRLVKNLQQHVTTHYGSVNGFLSDNGLKVSSSFASVSDAVGFEINQGNIR
jgi:hypothetical protein